MSAVLGAYSAAVRRSGARRVTGVIRAASITSAKLRAVRVTAIVHRACKRASAGGRYVAFLTAIGAAPVHAQPAFVANTDSALLARADSLSVGEFCTLTRVTLATPAIVTALDGDSTVARLSSATICDPLLAAFSLRALFGRTHAPMAAVARYRTDGNAAARMEIFEAMSEFRASVLRDSVRVVTREVLPEGTRQALTRMLTTSQGLLTSAARDRALERLARYERKLGPNSARLNGVEVLLNYAAQRWVPGFRADPLRGPSGWEVVASYAPGYVTVADDRAQAVSASELGVRRYLFGERFGATGFMGLFRPSYWSIGMLTASDRNGALVWPWEGRERRGVYGSWGSLKVGYIQGRRGEILLSKQFQAVPFLF
jgi:hypothetical protein